MHYAYGVVVSASICEQSFPGLPTMFNGLQIAAQQMGQQAKQLAARAIGEDVITP